MSETVTNYHPTVRPTGSAIKELIAGTSCFPGGAGLWRGEVNGGSLPEYFPDRPIMFVAHNFDSDRAFEASLIRKGEVQSDFWQRLIGILGDAAISPEDCFFSNALMGLKPGKATGPMPSVPGYREQCVRFLNKQVQIVNPRAVIALGVKAEKYVSKLDKPRIAIRHPRDWHFRELVTQKKRLYSEGQLLKDFLSKLT